MAAVKQTVFQTVDFLLKVLGVDEEQRRIETGVFERVVQKRVIERLVRKAGEQAGKELVTLANKAGQSDADYEEVEKKLKELFAKEEIEKLYAKVGEELFKEVLKEEYEKASEGDKENLDDLFDMKAAGA